MLKRFRISYIICFAFALLAFAGYEGKQNNPNVQQIIAQCESTENIQALEKSARHIEAGHTTPSESIRLQPNLRVHTATRIDHVARHFLISRYLSYLDDSFSLHTATTFTRALAFHIAAYRFLLIFPKHWFW